MPDDQPAPTGEFLLYQTEDGRSRIECRLRDETLWLSLNQISELFDRDKSVISKHLKNIFEEGELVRDSVVAQNATTAADGKTYKVDFFLRLSDYDVLTHAGRISTEQARQKAEIEYQQYRQRIDQQPSEVDKHLAEAIEKLGKIERNAKP